LKHQSSRYAKQIHEQNAHIAELQQQASRRAQQQADLQKLLASQEAEVQQQEHCVPDEELQEQLQQIVEQLSGTVQQQQQDRPRLFSDSDQQSTYGTFRQGRSSMQQQHFEARLQDPQQQYQQHQPQPQHQEGFPRLLQEVEVLARSSDYRDCQKGGCSFASGTPTRPMRSQERTCGG
jgi:chromosome segregation ATPase